MQWAYNSQTIQNSIKTMLCCSDCNGIHSLKLYINTLKKYIPLAWPASILFQYWVTISADELLNQLKPYKKALL